MPDPITLTLDDGVARIAMEDEPGRNALDARFVDALSAAFAAVEADQTVRAVLLTGLPDIFCAGAARSLLSGLLEGEVSVAELGLPRLLLACPVPVIAAMRGSAVGGGFALGLAADIVILAETARYGFNFLDLGLTPGMGVTWLGPARLGLGVGDELIYSTEYRRGRNLAASPGINHALPAAEVEPKAEDIARRIAQKPRDALSLLKAHQTRASLDAFDAAREEEMRMHRTRLACPETARLIRTNYIE
ncbi:MAG: polyketide synthase [Pseudomonadota bacterium]